MKIIPPYDVTPAVLTSNVAITETLWTAGTYTTGTRRYVGTKVYEVVASPSTSDQPEVGAAKPVPTWISIGSINRFKMFDFVIGDPTVQAGGPIEVTIDSGTDLINGVALFQVVGNTVRVRMTDPLEGVVYDQTKTLEDFSGINNYFQYFFAPLNTATEIVFTDLPVYIGADITVTVDANGSNTAVGELILGTIKNLGVTLQNFGFRIRDFSRKEQDSFGRFIVVERRFTKIASYEVFMENTQVNSAFRALSEVRATPVVYIGDENFLETISLGFYEDFQTIRTGLNSSEMILEVNGLT